MVTVLGGCSDIATEGPQPLNLELSASSTTTIAGQAIDVSFVATGSFLLGVDLDYGDGAVESIVGGGAHRLTGKRPHAWEEPGSYQVTAIARDGQLGSMTRSVMIQVASP
jgi:hypothetical protein